MNTELQNFFETIALAANTTTLFVNFRKLRIRFPAQSVKSALDQTADIEKIIDTLFYRKQVMWEHSSFEDKTWCMRSLIDLREKCDHEVEVFLGRQTSINDKDHFVASLLRTLGSYSDEAYKDIVKSNMTTHTLEKILKKFRRNSYPIIVTFLFSLPGNSIIKDNVSKKLESGLKNSRLSLKQVMPTWTIET